MTQATIYPLDLASVLDEVQNDNYDPLSSKLNTMAKQAVHSFVETEFTGSCGYGFREDAHSGILES